HPAAADQPAARAVVGQVAADPATPALCRHSLLRLTRRLQRQPECLRPGAAPGLRRSRFRDPPLRHPRPAVDPGSDPWAADGGQAPRGARRVGWGRERTLQRGDRDLRLRARRAGRRGSDRAGQAEAAGRARTRDAGGGAVTVVVGYIPNEYGEVALSAGIVEARRRGTGIVVVNSTRG